MSIINQYADRCYINSLLCDLSCNYYSTIYNITLLPTIFGSSVLTILNSADIDTNTMKIINITINGLNAVILSLINSYKLSDRINNYKTNKIKFIKLLHQIESSINKTDTSIDKLLLETIINDYDKLNEDLIYSFPYHIKQKIILKFGGIKTLPNSLEIEYQDNSREPPARANQPIITVL